jgi:hypothetical protein
VTIRINIVNEDTRETAVVKVEVKTPDGQKIKGGDKATLRGGESVGMYVHSSQSIFITEVSQ